MGKFVNWIAWGFLFGIGGIVITTILNFVFGGVVSYAFTNIGHTIGLSDSLMQNLGLVSGAFGIASMIFGILISIVLSIAFWFGVGLFSIITTPVLRKTPARTETAFILVPTLLILAFPLFLISLLPIIGLAIVLVFTVILAVQIWGQVGLYKTLRIQRYLPN